MPSEEKALKILQRHRLCDSCIGRQFTDAHPGMANDEIGRKIRSSLDVVGADAVAGTECYLCSELRTRLSELEESVPGRLKGTDFRTFLIGLSVPDSVVRREDELRMRYSLGESESIRREFSREVGRRLKEKLAREMDYERPDLTLIFDLREGGKLDIQINPVFVFGRYRKLERGISQTDRYCPACQGKGCEVCSFTGYENEESIESMISRTVAIAFQGADWKFHGGGREDIDARMLGNGRPFVVEVLKPRRRIVELGRMEREINETWKGRIEISGLRESSRREMQHIKTMKFDKTYEVTIAYSGHPDEEALSSLPQDMSGCEVRQETPRRVMPRRKDTTRRRLLKKLEVMEDLREKSLLKVRIRCESGLYVKELVNGDEGRTQPNMKELLGLEEAEVESLDVAWVHDDFR
jgi:tRNA pseudouridine synthase 10